jgi:hypothetical protein
MTDNTATTIAPSSGDFIQRWSEIASPEKARLS